MLSLDVNVGDVVLIQWSDIFTGFQEALVVVNKIGPDGALSLLRGDQEMPFHSDTLLEYQVLGQL